MAAMLETEPVTTWATVASQHRLSQQTDFPVLEHLIKWKRATNSWCQWWSMQPKLVGYRQSSWTAESVQLGERKGILPLNFATNIQMAACLMESKICSSMCTQLSKPDVEDAPAAAH